MVWPNGYPRARQVGGRTQAISSTRVQRASVRRRRSVFGGCLWPKGGPAGSSAVAPGPNLNKRSLRPVNGHGWPSTISRGYKPTDDNHSSVRVPVETSTNRQTGKLFLALSLVADRLESGYLSPCQTGLSWLDVLSLTGERRYPQVAGLRRIRRPAPGTARSPSRNNSSEAVGDSTRPWYAPKESRPESVARPHP
jgi:hypothetical protein